jgi:hexosaminidase
MAWLKQWLPLLALALLTLAPDAAWAANPAPAVVPAGRQWTGGKGMWKFSGAQVAVPAAEWSALAPVARRLAADLGRLGVASEAIPVAGELLSNDLVLTTNTGNFQLRNEEGYAIEITDRVIIRGQTPTAVFWGTRTLLQMLHQDRRQRLLPRGALVDWPQYPHRILRLCVGNRFLPLATLKDYVACMSWFKLNELQLCLNGADTGVSPQGFFRMECDAVPGLTSREHYTRHQLRELQDWAADHGVAIIPEIAIPSDALAFTQVASELRHPWLDKSQIDVRNPAATGFLQLIFDEILPLFDARIVHFGSTAYPLAGVPVDRQTEFAEAYRRHVDRLATYAQSRFNKTIRSSEVELPVPGGMAPLRNTTLAVWQPSEIAGLRLAAGYKIINASLALPPIGPNGAGLQPVSRSLYETWTPEIFGENRLPPPDPLDEAPGLVGASLSLWEGRQASHQTIVETSRMTMGVVVAFAEKCWGAGRTLSYPDFEKRVAVVGIDPESHLFDRLPAMADGLVLRRSALYDLKTPADRVDLLAPGDERLLEWPWTMAVEVYRQSSGDGILFSTPTVEIYGALTWTAEPGARRQVSRGIGLVRSSGNAVAPLQSQLPMVAVVATALPKQRWSRLVLVGERDRTTAYLDGVKAGEVEIQMACPLGALGGRHNDSFPCRLRNLEIWNRAWSAAEIEQWKPAVRNWWQSGNNVTLGKP